MPRFLDTILTFLLRNPKIKDVGESTAVILYGDAFPEWVQALGARGRAWKTIEGEKGVFFSNDPELQPSEFKQDQKIIIPLFEANIRNHPKGFLSLIPSVETLSILENKKEFVRFMEGKSFSEYMPRHFSCKNTILPIVYKPAIGYAGHGMYIIRNEEDLPDMEGDFLLEEYIEDRKEYTTHCVCNRGEIIWSQTLECILFEDNPIKNGATSESKTEFIPNEVTMNVFSKILMALNYEGPCNFNYKLKDGSPLILEINPRFGGSLMIEDYSHHLSKALEAIITYAH